MSKDVESLRQFKHLIGLAEHGHFGRAADALGLTQPALTLSIQKLESTYGVPLFERRKGGLVLTHYGEAVLEVAQVTIKRLTHLRRELALIRKLAVGRVIIGCDPHFAESLLAPAIARLMKAYPNLEFTIEIGKWSQLQPQLMTKQIDLYVGFEIEEEDALLNIEKHAIPPFVVFCSAGHPILKLDQPSILDTIGYPMVIPPTTRWLQARIQPVIASAGVSKRIPTLLHTTDYGIVRKFVRESGALGFGQLRDARQEQHTGAHFEYFTLRELNSEVPITFITLERRSLPAATMQLLKDLRIEVAAMRDEWAVARSGGAV